MTAAMLANAGVVVESGGAALAAAGNGAGPAACSWRIRPGRLAPGTIAVEPDLSNAAPFLAAALATRGRGGGPHCCGPAPPPRGPSPPVVRPPRGRLPRAP